MRRVAALLVEGAGVGRDGCGRSAGRVLVRQTLGGHDRKGQFRPEDNVFRAIPPRQIDDRFHRLAAPPGDAHVGQARKFAGRCRVLPVGIDHRHRVGQYTAAERLAPGVAYR